jgi:predicted GIY-YIG superfamily endonuclease
MPVVYLLTTLRSGPYFIGVADGLQGILDQQRDLHQWRECAGENGICDPFLVAWYEEHLDAASAQARAVEIRSWPQRWQHRLVEGTNSEWRHLAPLIVHRVHPFIPLPEAWHYIPAAVPPKSPPPDTRQRRHKRWFRRLEPGYIVHVPPEMLPLLQATAADAPPSDEPTSSS